MANGSCEKQPFIPPDPPLVRRDHHPQRAVARGSDVRGVARRRRHLFISARLGSVHRLVDLGVRHDLPYGVRAHSELRHLHYISYGERQRRVRVTRLEIGRHCLTWAGDQRDAGATEAGGDVARGRAAGEAPHVLCVLGLVVPSVHRGELCLELPERGGCAVARLDHGKKRGASASRGETCMLATGWFDAPNTRVVRRVGWFDVKWVPIEPNVQSGVETYTPGVHILLIICTLLD